MRTTIEKIIVLIIILAIIGVTFWYGGILSGILMTIILGVLWLLGLFIGNFKSKG